MNGLDLFSGIGGITKALEGYVKPIAYCENDRYAQGVLLSRMHTKDLPIAPIWDDIRTLRRDCFPIMPEIIYGGFPCQDISNAGHRQGLGGERSGLFSEIIRLVGEIRPSFVFLENVSAITIRGAERVVRELCRLRYDCRWGILSAADVGANHRRERWWLLAHHDSGNGGTSRESEIKEGSTDVAQPGSKSERMANTPKLRREQKHANGGRQSEGTVTAKEWRGSSYGSKKLGDPFSIRWEGQSWRWSGFKSEDSDSRGSESKWWSIEPNVGRVANGIPLRVDRLRGLGNAVVPAQAREAFERLMGLKHAQ